MENQTGKQVTVEQAAAIARVIDGWSSFGVPQTVFQVGFGISYVVIYVKMRGHGIAVARIEIQKNGRINSTVYTGMICRHERDVAINAELAGEGMRLADNDEPGWYVTTSFGTVWATDLPVNK